METRKSNGKIETVQEQEGGRRIAKEKKIM